MQFNAILRVPHLSAVAAGIVSGQYPLEEGPLSQMSDAVASLDKEPHTPAQQVNTKYFYPTDQIFSLRPRVRRAPPPPGCLPRLTRPAPRDTRARGRPGGSAAPRTFRTDK